MFGGWPADDKYETRKYLADFFAFGSPKIMKNYCDIHLMKAPLPTSVKRHPFNSENQLSLYLKKNKIDTDYVLKNRQDYEIKR